MIMVLFSAPSLPPIKEGVSDAWGKSQRDKGPLFLPSLVFTGGGGGAVKGNPQLLVCPLGDLKKPLHDPKCRHYRVQRTDTSSCLGIAQAELITSDACFMVSSWEWRGPHSEEAWVHTTSFFLAQKQTFSSYC